MATSTNVNVRIDNAISTKAAPDLLPVFSQAITIKDKGIVFVSGNIGVDPRTNQLVSGVKEQTTQVLNNIKAVLEAAGSGLSKVVKVNVYITDMRDFEAMNEAYLGVFENPQPARTCVQVVGLPFQAQVEMECQALL